MKRKEKVNLTHVTAALHLVTTLNSNPIGQTAYHLYRDILLRQLPMQENIHMILLLEEV